MGKPKLGRGLASLIAPITQIQNIDVERILLTDQQLTERENYLLAELEDLAEKIQQRGIKTPFPVVKDKGGFLLLERLKTFCAALLVCEQIPIIVRPHISNHTDPIVEQLEKAQQNPIALAQTYSSIMMEQQLTQEELSEKIKRSRSSIANTLRLLNLPFDMRMDIQNGILSAGHGIALLRLPKQEQRLLYGEIKNENLNIAQTQLLAQKRQNKLTRSSEIEQLLQEKSVQYRAQFKSIAKGSTLSIEFSSREELIAFLKRLP